MSGTKGMLHYTIQMKEEAIRVFLKKGKHIGKLAINRNVLKEEHPDTARSLNNLGYLLQAMGALPGAKPYYEQALAILEM